MPVHTLTKHSEDTSFVDGLPVGFSSFDPDAESGSGSAVDLLDPAAEAEVWNPFGAPVQPLGAKGDDEDYEDEDDDDDDDLWDDDDDDDDDDDFEDDEDDDFDDDDDDPFTLDDDEDDDF